MSAYVVQQPQDGGVATIYEYQSGLGGRVANRTACTRLGIRTEYRYDQADRITQAGLWSMNVNYVGNETTRGLDTFTYDQANRQTTASPAGGLTTTYVYDGDGKPMKRLSVPTHRSTSRMTLVPACQSCWTTAVASMCSV